MSNTDDMLLGGTLGQREGRPFPGQSARTLGEREGAAGGWEIVPLWWCVVHHGHASSPPAGGCCSWTRRDECRAVQCWIPAEATR